MLTETSILMEMSNNLVESQTATNSEFLDYAMLLITIISITITGCIAYYNAKKNKEITKMTLEATTQNIITQMHQGAIRKTIKKLSTKVQSREIKKIREVLDSDEGIYIPLRLKKKIEENLYLYLFSWDNVPRLPIYRSESERLLWFLKDAFYINWTENAEIRKSDDDKIISITKDENLAEIKIDDKKEKVTLKISDGRTNDLKVKKENGKLNIYENLTGDVNPNTRNLISVLINEYINPPSTAEEKKPLLCRLFCHYSRKH